MNELELKPCPFCGRTAILQEDEDHHGGYFSLGCASDPLGDDTCPGKAVYYTEPIENKENAIRLWNSRSVEGALRAENEHLLSDLKSEQRWADQYQKETEQLTQILFKLQAGSLYTEVAQKVNEQLAKNVDRLRARVNEAIADEKRDGVTMSGYISEIERLQARVAELEKVDRWIPVSEKLPDDGILVLVCTREGEIYPMTFQDSQWYETPDFCGDTEDVTHWREFPEPPAEWK